jgi:hypothetical protein
MLGIVVCTRRVAAVNACATAQLVATGGMRGAVVERMKDDPPSLKLRRDAGDEDGVPARGDQDDPSAPSFSGGGKVQGKLGRVARPCVPFGVRLHG